jgi:hypothetical protein
LVETITRTVTVTEAPDVPAAAHLPSRYPALALARFATPGGNIGCTLSGGSARCDIARRMWTLPKQPRGCRLDWGQGLQVRVTGPAGFVCAGDSVLDPSGLVVPNGRDVEHDSVICQIRQVGVTCFAKDGHGFSLSRSGYTTF